MRGGFCYCLWCFTLSTRYLILLIRAGFLFLFSVYFLCSFFLLYIFSTFTPSKKYLVYLALPIITVSFLFLFSPSPSNSFHFLEPEIIDSNIFPEDAPSSYSLMKILLNGESRWGTPFKHNGHMKFKASVSSHSSLVFGLGFISQDTSPKDIKICLTVIDENGIHEELNNFDFKPIRNSWFDIKVDMEKWKGQDVVIEIKDENADLINKWEKPENLFLNRPRLIQNNPESPQKKT